MRAASIRTRDSFQTIKDESKNFLILTAQLDAIVRACVFVAREIALSLL
jgi:hypothetical protein